VGDRRAENRHQAVSGELVHDAFVAVHAGNGVFQVGVEELPVVFGVEPLGDPRATGQVAEEYRDLALLAFDASTRGEYLLSQPLGHVAGKRGGGRSDGR